jgi:hypothetical protein
MRLLGAVLLIGGFLLCVSIAWAAIGFFMMGFGLICLLIAERKNKRSSDANFPLQARSPNLEPRVGRVSANYNSDRGSNVGDSSSYDEARWNSLVQNDPDLLRLVAVLTPYGLKYVAELATAYLAVNDKRYLPTILKEVVASARRDAGEDVTSELKVIRNPNASRRSQRVKRASALQAVYDVVVDDPVVVHLLPQRDTKQDRLSAEPQPELTGNRPGGGTGARQEPDREDAQAASFAPEPSHASRSNSLEDADTNSLADLLNSFILNAPSDKTRP